MRRFSKRQILVAGAAAAIVAAGAGVAFAYWTSSGTGTGDASTTSGTQVSVHQVSAPTAMAPGTPAGAITFYVKNDSTSTSAQVANVTIAIASVTPGTIAATHTCDSTDYTLTQPTWTAVELAPGTSSSNNATATLGFKDDPAVNQDSCQGAVVHLTYTSS